MPLYDSFIFFVPRLVFSLAGDFSEWQQDALDKS